MFFGIDNPCRVLLRVLRVTPREFVGRVSSVLQPIITAVSLLSTVMAGTLASTALHDVHASFLGFNVGPIDTIFTGAGMLGLLGGLYARLNLCHLPSAEEKGEEVPKSLT